MAKGNDMKNKYLKNLNKIEFVVTWACTGKCKHCSEGEHAACGEHISPALAADAVKRFAAQAKACGIPMRLSPAWLVSREDNNPYNKKTREILGEFAELEIPVGAGNVIFPEGNACKYLAEYFKDVSPENPYVDDPCDVRCASFSPNGDVLNGNAYERDVMEILKNYAP